MKRSLIIIFILFSILFVFSYGPNIIESMVSRGSSGQDAAMLIIGSKVEYTFKDGDTYIGEDKSDWKWIIKNLGSESATNIADTSDDRQHSGPIIGIKNSFVADDISDSKGIGSGYCLPSDYVCINFKGLTVEDYATYTISQTSVDLSEWNSGWSNKDCILIQSNKDNGLKLQGGNLDINTAISDQTTDKVWVVFNNTGSYAGIFYKDNVGYTQVSGFVNMNAGGVDKNIVDVNNKRSGNIEIDLRGNFGAGNNLDLVLDIQGFEGTVSNDGQDDITINLMHSANDDFDGFGTTANSAENIDLVWQNTNIGKKDEDHRSIYGIIIKNPESNCGNDRVKLEVPWGGQEKANIEIVGASVIKEAEYTKEIGEEPKSILDTEIRDKEKYNLILIGGPCINSLVEKFEEFPKCKDWNLKDGESIIKVIEKNDKSIMLIAGTTEEDTKKSVSKYLDSSDYPDPYTKDTLIVIGEKASRKDVLGAVDILTNLIQETKSEIKYSEVMITTSDEIPLGTALGASGFFRTNLDKSDINTLQDTSVIFSGDDYNTHDEIMLYNQGPKIETSLSSGYSDYGSDVYMELLSGRLRYYYVFDEKINLSDISSTDELEFKFLNNNLIITDVDSTNQFTARVSKGYYMKTGDEIIIEGIKVKLVDVGIGGRVILEIDGAEQIFDQGLSKNFGGLNIISLATFF